MDRTFLDLAIAAAVLTAAVVPAVRGAVRDHRDNLALRNGEDRPDRRTGVLVTFDLAFGPHRDRVRRVGPGRPAARRTRAPAVPARQRPPSQQVREIAPAEPADTDGAG